MSSGGAGAGAGSVCKGAGAVALFNTRSVKGTVVFTQRKLGVHIEAVFTMLEGLHGFHIHTAGDLRGEGCKMACDHYHAGPEGAKHGGPPSSSSGRGTPDERHTGDLGNVTRGTYTYLLKNIHISDLWGRSVIIHADEDDLGLGGYPSGKRIACAIIGRSA